MAIVNKSMNPFTCSDNRYVGHKIGGGLNPPSVAAKPSCGNNCAERPNGVRRSTHSN
jgi:hypothetical protein